MRFIKLPEVVARTGIPKSSVYWRSAREELPPPIKIGERSSAWISDEIDAVMHARAGGASSEDVRELVRSLVAGRKTGGSLSQHASEGPGSDEARRQPGSGKAATQNEPPKKLTSQDHREQRWPSFFGHEMGAA